MIRYEEIRDVHLEISSLCNAACPWCPRTFWGYPYNGGYPEVNLTLANAQKIFSYDFLQQLKSIRINGNFGDIVMNPQGADIVKYFISQNSNLNISINTNGSARTADFWKKLARLGATVSFALDGLEDTHHLYRQNTSWQQVIKNAKTFIAAGGQATWQMIRFAHNQHQIESCRDMSQQLGFSRFFLLESSRNSAPVFDRHGNLVHVMGDYKGEKDFKILFHKKTTDRVLLEDVIVDKTPCSNVQCETVKSGSIYIAANGDVSPCCWTGFYPNSYGRGQYHEAANQQLVHFIAKNNALTYSLPECIEWFQKIKDSWKIDRYESGRLLICDDNCGQRNLNQSDP